MKVIALISGGKDSCYNMLQCIAEGHTIIGLANLHPPVESGKDELDSYMYQCVGHEGVSFYAEAMDLPLYRLPIKGTPLVLEKSYHPTDNDEVEDLYQLLCLAKKELPEAEGVSSGAILSDYQRTRVENVCGRLGLTSLAFLWRRDQHQLLREMIGCRLYPIIIKVASYGLTPSKHLGRYLGDLESDLVSLSTRCDLNVCGEGGEYETFTLDSPLFRRRLVMSDSEIVTTSEAGDYLSPVAHLKITKMSTEAKSPEEVLLTLSDMQKAQLPIVTADTFLSNLSSSVKEDISASRLVEVDCASGHAVSMGLDDASFHVESLPMRMVGNVFGFLRKDGKGSVYQAAQEALENVLRQLKVAKSLDVEADTLSERAASSARMDLFTKTHALRKQLKDTNCEIQDLDKLLQAKHLELAQ